jgi:hypothetical protein
MYGIQEWKSLLEKSRYRNQAKLIAVEYFFEERRDNYALECMMIISPYNHPFLVNRKACKLFHAPFQ